MSSGAPITPDEMMEVMARDVPADLRLAARMPGASYRQFHNADQLWAYMHEQGYVDKVLYNKALNDRFSFRTHLPARSAPDFIKSVSEAKNPTPQLAMVSQAVGAKRIGEDVVAIRREDVPGMPAKDVMDLIREPLVRNELSFEGGMELLEVLAAKQVEEGSLESDEMKDFMRAARAFKVAMGKLAGMND